MASGSWLVGKRFALVAAVICTAAGRIAAQTPTGQLFGTVMDANTGEPLALARVQLVEAHREELSHAEGDFQFLEVPPGTYTLVAERLGYGRYEGQVAIQAGVTTQVQAVIQVRAVVLGSLVVTGTLTPRRGEDVLSPVTTLSGAELERLNDQTIAAMLEDRPGLTSSSLGPAAARPIIRGLGGDRILVLEDGQRLGDMSSTSSDHAVASDPLTARQVEVVRGPMSLMYGSSALGGVVNIVREGIPKSMPDRVHGTFLAQGASVNDALTAGGYGLVGLGPLALRAEGSARTFGDIRTPGGTLENTGGRVYDASASIGLPMESGHSGASYQFYANDYGIPGGFVGGHATGVDISMRRHALRGQAELHRESGLLARLSADAGYTRYNHEELEPSGSIGTSYLQDLWQGEMVVRHAPRGMFREGAGGLVAKYRSIETGGTLRTPSTSDYTLSAFLIEELGPDALRFQLGVRYDFAEYTPADTTSFVLAGGERIPVRSRRFGALSGSAGTLWTVAEAFRVGASVSRAFRTPDFNELFSNGPHLAANSYDVGDPTLGQETGFGIDLFARVTTERVQAEVAAFRNVLSDYIFPSSRGRAELGAQGGRPRFQYTNEDARFVGVEGEVLASVGEMVQLEASASVVQARFTSPRAPIPVFDGADTTFVEASKVPPLIPPVQGRVGARLEQSGYFAGVGAKLVSRQDRVGDFETPTSGYQLWDFTAGVRLTRGNMLHAVTLRIDNALDREYRDHMSRVKDIVPGSSRSVSLLYRMVF